MLYKPAEETFRKGLEALHSSGGEKEAMALFEASLLLDSRHQNGSGQPRYRSYYGLCLATQGKKVREGLKLCRKAGEDEFFNWEIWFNLGKVEMAAGNRFKAHNAFLRALHLSPRKAEVRAYLQELGLRRPPVFSFLSRDHFLNRFLGRLTYRKPENLER
jgi:tetratricopeptide (TPR) repeat protein